MKTVFRVSDDRGRRSDQVETALAGLREAIGGNPDKTVRFVGVTGTWEITMHSQLREPQRMAAEKYFRDNGFTVLTQRDQS
jgi:hypothetical protein